MPGDGILESQRVERSSHAICRLVIITATLVAEREHTSNAMVSLRLFWGAALVLVLAHTYSVLIPSALLVAAWISARAGLGANRSPSSCSTVGFVRTSASLADVPPVESDTPPTPGTRAQTRRRQPYGPSGRD